MDSEERLLESWSTVMPLAITFVVVLLTALSTWRTYFEKAGVYVILRSFLLLPVVGFVLHLMFDQGNVWILFLVSVVTYTACKREHVPSLKYDRASIVVGTAITLFLLVILKVFPFTARIIIPIAGMIVVNAMTVTDQLTMKRPLRNEINAKKLGLIALEAIEVQIVAMMMLIGVCKVSSIMSTMSIKQCILYILRIVFLDY